MVAHSPAPAAPTTPYSDVTAFIVEAHYRKLGCEGWNSPRVQRLCGKLGDTPTVLAARLRISPSLFLRKLETNAWTKQDALLLTLFEREVDFLKGGIPDRGALIPRGGAS